MYNNVFNVFRDKLKESFDEMVLNVETLFYVDIEPDKLYDIYINSFQSGNEIYRKRKTHDCSACRNFIRNFGGVIAIINGEVWTIWDINMDGTIYAPVVKAMRKAVREASIAGVKVCQLDRYGIIENNERDPETKLIVDKWDHLYVDIPDRMMNDTGRSIGDVEGAFRDQRNCFKRSLEEINIEALNTVIELSEDRTLYKGEEWVANLRKFRDYHIEYHKLSEEEKDIFAWEKSIDAGPVIGKIRNHSIGVLLTDLSEGVDLEVAVKRYERIVAPSNYKRPKAIFTQKMLDDARKTIEELGYTDSLARRFANIDDITVRNILFANKTAAKRIPGSLDVFDQLSRETTTKAKSYDNAVEIGIDEFVKDILPKATEIEAYVENRHAENFVSLIAPVNKGSKTMFKWDNNFSWAYAGNVTDSMKERVKEFGGKVDGDLRFSIQWNEDGNDNSDVDAHCDEYDNYNSTNPSDRIYFNSHCKCYDGFPYGVGYSENGGQLDVDIRVPNGEIAVENIVYSDKRKIKDGTMFSFFVHQYSGCTTHGFRAEIEFDGCIYSFNYDKPTRQGAIISVARVVYKDGKFTIEPALPTNTSSKSIWNVQTNNFIPVTIAMYSPNHWDDQCGVGNKHYFFMLKDCKNDTCPNGIFNEYLKEDLMVHKRVFEALGSKLAVHPDDNQLSGLGFSSTKRNSLVVRVKDTTTVGLYRINF